MTTFRAVVKPRKKTVSTDLAGTLDFEDKFNSIDFTSGQSANISTLTNVLHWIDGQTIMIHNSGVSDVIIDASLMEDALAIDVEQDTTTLLFWIASIGKFKDQGGTARIKNVEVDFAAHTHNGTDAPKVAGSNITATGIAADWVLTADGAGNAAWVNHPSIIHSHVKYQNTDITTNLNVAATEIEIPITGTVVNINATDFTTSGNGVVCNFTGSVRAIANMHVTSGTTKTEIHVRLKKTTTGLFGPLRTYFIAVGTTDDAGGVSGSIDVTSGDKITLTSTSFGATGVLTMNAAGSCTLEVERTE